MRGGQHAIKGQATLCESELVSTETERQRSLTELGFLLHACGVAKPAVILRASKTPATGYATGYATAVQQLSHHIVCALTYQRPVGV